MSSAESRAPSIGSPTAAGVAPSGENSPDGRAIPPSARSGRHSIRPKESAKIASTAASPLSSELARPSKSNPTNSSRAQAFSSSLRSSKPMSKSARTDEMNASGMQLTRAPRSTITLASSSDISLAETRAARSMPVNRSRKQALSSSLTSTPSSGSIAATMEVTNTSVAVSAARHANIAASSATGKSSEKRRRLIADSRPASSSPASSSTPRMQDCSDASKRSRMSDQLDPPAMPADTWAPFDPSDPGLAPATAAVLAGGTSVGSGAAAEVAVVASAAPAEVVVVASATGSMIGSSVPQAETARARTRAVPATRSRTRRPARWRDVDIGVFSLGFCKSCRDRSRGALPNASLVCAPCQCLTR